MPQEAGTVQLIARRGAGILLEKASDIVPTPTGMVILGFADGEKAHFGGYVMDPETVVASPNGLLRLQPIVKAAE